MTSKARAAGTPPDLPKDNVHQLLRAVSKQAPRFLFRAWSKRSGGDARLNTPDAITPLAFLHGKGPASIEKIPAIKLIELWNGHYRTTKSIKTIFSSWSQSLQVAVGWFGKPDGYLSIIDTTQLPSHNIIAFTASVKGIKPGMNGGSHEYLVFGVVSGKGHRAVRIQDLAEQSGFDQSWHASIGGHPRDAYRSNAAGAMWIRLPLGPSQATRSEEAVRLAAARRVAELFGPDFELAVACYLLTLGRYPALRNMRSVTDKLASEYDVPREWLNDRRGDEMGGFADFADAVQAVELLRAVAERKHGETGLPDCAVNARGPTKALANGPETIRSADAHGGMGVEGDVASISSAHVEDLSALVTRLPKPVRDLYIDMHGWKPEDFAGRGLWVYPGPAMTPLYHLPDTPDKHPDHADPIEAPRPTAFPHGVPRAVKELYTDLKGYTPIELTYSGFGCGALLNFASAFETPEVVEHMEDGGERCGAGGDDVEMLDD
ncbi:hypothetical protein B0A55_01790 [Friedmanniomyces simplex]|uniref:DUF7587 domain-containing protein n=1 Tax=Friedmanniomyces simplex TaxID=329884 RepID=A0A4U0Y243_9PEZI|nr:hypothetical protein B0A55_01790 [Friedmanniomyces simplex]